MVRRRKGTEPEADDAPAVSPDDTTLVVERHGVGLDDSTLIVDRAVVAEDDRTVIVEPYDPEVPDGPLGPDEAEERLGAAEAAALEPDDDDTVSVSTEADEADRPPARVPAAPVVLDEDRTVIVEAEDGPSGWSSAADLEPAQDTTIPVPKRGDTTGESRSDSGSASGTPSGTASSTGTPKADQTVKVDRAAHGPTQQVRAAGTTPVRPVMTPPRKRRRGELRPAPVPSGFGGMPLVASGAGAVSTYRARALRPPPAYLGVFGGSRAAKRLPAGGVSVARRSRVLAFTALASAAAAALVLAAGVFWAVKDLAGF
ncbi:MAG: hypothetical protein J7480_08095 [Microbacteriaceae bacterium]|nr:hypothetical protein [Microbacteriaceae bacterium]